MDLRTTPTSCAREGCKYPVSEEALVCSACKGRFHPTCSDLTPEAFTSFQTAKAWKCSSCVKCHAAGDSGHSNQPHIITYITSNPNKLRETLEILGDQYTPLFRSLDVDLPEYQGVAEEIAISKCRFAAEQVDGPVLVEDTSLGFDALKGLPGPYIKWFLKAVGAQGLQKMLIGFGAENNTASATCTFAFCDGRGQPVRLFQGVTRGRIVEPRGSSGFGWDPCFLPEGYQSTYAEMDKATKNSLSHRFKAVLALRQFLDENPKFSSHLHCLRQTADV
ncbi:hypothetical protein AAHC03_026995 [Spirometra sp. Aus1]